MANQHGDKSKDENDSNDVQNYLITRYRDALKSGDKSYAKSCLLATRLFSVNDKNITNEIYLMAKSDGDVGEAAKCFANIFTDLMLANRPTKEQQHETNLCDTAQNCETQSVINQMKEEIRLLLTELKAHYLKLKSVVVTSMFNQQTRQAPSVAQSPMLSPRLRLASEDRAASKETVAKLDSHLHNATKRFFYQQLFDNLPKEVRKSLLDYSIENCDSPFEQCRLMILAISIFKEETIRLGSKLLKTLIDLSQSTPPNEKTNAIHQDTTTPGPSRSSIMSYHAKSMLVLDAIPLVFNNISKSEKLNDIRIEDLLMIVFDYYSKVLLENAANEYEFDELHEGMIKTIAARILGKDLINANSKSDQLLDRSGTGFDVSLIASIELLMDKYLEDMTCEDKKRSFSNLTEATYRKNYEEDLNHSFRIPNFINSNEFENDIPDSILLDTAVHDETTNNPSSQGSNNSVSTPTRTRGRPKKVQASVIVAPDDEVVKNLHAKAKMWYFLYFATLRYLFPRCLYYLRQTKSRILMRFNNPLAQLIEDQLKAGTQNSSAPNKSTNKQSQPSEDNKRLKLDEHAELNIAPDARGTNHSVESKGLKQFRKLKGSPLNTEQNRTIDASLMATLEKIQWCLKLLGPNSEFPILNKLWIKFNKLFKFDGCGWFSRLSAEALFHSQDNLLALDELSKIVESANTEPQIKKDPNDMDTSTLTVNTGSNSVVEVKHLRASAQMISAALSIEDKPRAYHHIDRLLFKIRLSGLLSNDAGIVGYNSGNIIDEYMTLVEPCWSPNDPDLGFLFFDTLSMIRYVVDILKDILEKYINHGIQKARGKRTPPIWMDNFIGHCIVLSQMDWPRHAALYERCITWIRTNKPVSLTPQCLSQATKFTYTEFINYVVNPTIIEDFLSLVNDGYTLELGATGGGSGSGAASSSQASDQSSQQSSGEQQHSQQRTSARQAATKTMTTRGVNRNFKDQLKYMLIDQMEQSSILMPLDLITNFVQSSLLPSLLSAGKTKSERS